MLSTCNAMLNRSIRTCTRKHYHSSLITPPSRFRFLSVSTIRHVMASATLKSENASLSHEERTAEEPREVNTHLVILQSITRVNDRIQTYRFSTKNNASIPFQSGQWVDLFVPGIDKAGGFTITSTPNDSTSKEGGGASPFIELAVQQSPENPPAAWLWQHEDAIVGKELTIRVGGSFVWPPRGFQGGDVKRVVLFAGGVGINPLISILSQIRETYPGFKGIDVMFLYSTKLPTAESEEKEVLFLPRLLNAIHAEDSGSNEVSENNLELFFTGTWDGSPLSMESKLVRKFKHTAASGETAYAVSAHVGRVQEQDLIRALGNDEKRNDSAYYVCGPPEMTDGIVKWLKKQGGVEPEQVMCEKWW